MSGITLITVFMTLYNRGYMFADRDRQKEAVAAFNDALKIDSAGFK